MKSFAPFLFGLSLLFISACQSDDNNGPNLRDRGVVANENRATIQNFLKTHTFEVIPDPSNPDAKTVKFDSISSGSDTTSIMESPELKSKNYTQDGVTYKIYYLQIQKGAPEAYQPTIADRAILSYKTYSINLELADAAARPTRADLPGAKNTRSFIRGAIEGIIEFRGASNVTQNPDGTLTYSDDYGLGAVFIPSGLAYFAQPPQFSGIGPYEPIIFNFRLFQAIRADHDEDGIPSIIEDLNNNGLVVDDNTDGDDSANYLDSDDDNDRTPTSEEISVEDSNNDRIITKDEITFPDYNNDGTPDYLDPQIN